jgi:hypothetical protein
MGFGLSLKRQDKSVKLIRKYLNLRIREKHTFLDQIERLDSQLQNNTIDRYTYDRLRDVLEINFIKQRDETLEKIFL